MEGQERIMEGTGDDRKRKGKDKERKRQDRKGKEMAGKKMKGKKRLIFLLRKCLIKVI